MRDKHLASRYSVEEFLAILLDTDEDSALSIAEILRKAIWDLKWDIPDFSVTVSLGVKQYVDETADELLYKAKQSGRNRTCR